MTIFVNLLMNLGAYLYSIFVVIDAFTDALFTPKQNQNKIKSDLSLIFSSSISLLSLFLDSHAEYSVHIPIYGGSMH